MSWRESWRGWRRRWIGGIEPCERRFYRCQGLCVEGRTFLRAFLLVAQSVFSFLGGSCQLIDFWVGRVLSGFGDEREESPQVGLLGNK